MSKLTPCDTEPFDCPFDARYSEDCRYHCGLGVDEPDEDEYIEDHHHDWMSEEESWF